MTTIRLKGGRIVDPANGVDGEIRDLGIQKRLDELFLMLKKQAPRDSDWARTNEGRNELEAP